MTNPDVSSQKDQRIASTTNRKIDLVPPQYKNLPSEVVERLWQNVVFVDPEKNHAETERRKQALEAIKEIENEREKTKQKLFDEKYSKLTPEQKNEFSIAKKEAKKIIDEYIQNSREIENLSSEEFFVLNKLKTAYANHDTENANIPFTLNFLKDIDRTIYKHLVLKLAFRIFEKKQQLNDQKEADAIRENLGITRKKIQAEKTTSLDQGPLQDYENLEDEDDGFREILDTYKRIYYLKRVALNETAFAIARGFNPETNEPFDLVSGETGNNFDAHGIAKTNQIDNLLALLKNGIDRSKPFYTAPFDVPDNIKRAMAAATGTSGGTAYKDGIAVVTSGYKEKLLEQGIKHVFINDVYQDLIAPLKKTFPQYNFHLLSEQKQVMEDESFRHSYI